MSYVLDSSPPGLDCLTEGHILVIGDNPDCGQHQASWCIWCGTGVTCSCAFGDEEEQL